jgi:predicted Zn-dependent protease
LAPAIACAAAPGGGRDAESYLRWVAFDLPFESVLLRWRDDQMPLRVHLPKPPDGLFEDPQAIWESVRDGITDWTDAARPGVPRFELVDDAGQAHIPIVWARRPAAGEGWYIAFCAWDINWAQRRFGVSHIIVTARWNDDRLADLHDVYETVLHEMGHALGLGGHSPDPKDIMYPSVDNQTDALSERDRSTLAALYARPVGSRVVGARK